MKQPERAQAINPLALTYFKEMVTKEFKDLGINDVAFIEGQLKTLESYEPTNPEFRNHRIDTRWIDYRNGFLAGEILGVRAATPGPKSGLQSIRVEAFRIRNKVNPKLFKQAGWRNYPVRNGGWRGWSTVGKVWPRRSIGSHLGHFKVQNKTKDWRADTYTIIDPSLDDNVMIYQFPDNYELVDAQTGEIVDWSVILPKGAIVRFKKDFHIV